MTIYQTILKRRTIRLFKNKKIPDRVLEKLVNVGRVAPSARNIQPLEYIVIDDKALCEKVFENVHFGGETEKLRIKENRPLAYIFVMTNQKIRSADSGYDVGLAVENIILTAYEEGIGACIMGAIDRPKLVKILNVPVAYVLDLVLALGYPAEKPKIEEEKQQNYWRDKKGVLHIPKRPLKEILHWNSFKKRF